MPQVISTTRNSQLEELSLQFSNLSKRVQQLVENLHLYQLNLRPEEGRWSIAECLVHLNLFSEQLLPSIRQVCDNARQSGVVGKGPFRMDSVGRLLKYSLEPPYRMRVSTSAPFEPATIEPIEDIVPQFVTLQTELITTIEEAGGLDLNRIKITSPLSRHVRYNLFSCFNVIAAHQRRHLWQAEQVKSAILARNN